VCLAIPGRVVDMLDEQRSIACVEVAGVRRGVDVGLLASERDRVRAGDWVLVHVGFAISRIDELEARATLRLLQAMGAEYEQELAELRASVA
jgi:hydrogenase expression/formation protein HypC